MQVISRADAKALGQDWYFTGKPCIKGHLSKRQTSNGVCHECRTDRWHEQHKHDYRRIMARSAKRRAKHHEIPFTIEHTDIVIPSHCPCCGIKLVSLAERTHKMKTGDRQSPSLDRKVPSKGYVPGNIAVLCMRCNLLKSGVTPEMLEFLIHYLG